jgi:hypothetical protein
VASQGQGPYPGPPFDVVTANTTVYLATYIKCDVSTYATADYDGPAKGFQYEGTFYDAATDMRGMRV